MELHQIRYFFHVATRGGLAPAAAHLRLSLPALSKAVAKLEDELATKLFERKRSGLALTPAGEHFLIRAEEILALVDKAAHELRGQESVPELVLAGREIFLERFGPRVARLFQERHGGAPVTFKDMGGEDALRAVDTGEAHLALVIQDPPKGWSGKDLAKLSFVTAAGKRHPLAKARDGRIPIKEVLSHPFVSPNQPIFGRIGSSRSIDGWRDDVHPRRIAYVVESLSLFLRLIRDGEALGYLPDFLAEDYGLVPLRVSGCGFDLKQAVHLVAKRADDLSWLGQLVRSI